MNTFIQNGETIINTAYIAHARIYQDSRGNDRVSITITTGKEFLLLNDDAVRFKEWWKTYKDVYHLNREGEP